MSRIAVVTGIPRMVPLILGQPPDGVGFHTKVVGGQIRTRICIL